MSAIVYEKRNRVAYVTLNRPEAMNALGWDQSKELTRIWMDFRDDSDVWMAILTGTGEKTLCAGADLKTYTPSLGARNAYDVRQEANRLGFGDITCGLEIWKPLLAAVNGYAMAGGLELALACDIRVASENVQFGCSEVRRGFHHCDGGTVRLPLIVGCGNTLKMQLTGEPVNAQEALRIGWVRQVVSSKALTPTAERYVSLIIRT